MRRLIVAALAAACVCLAPPARAHVEVSPETAPRRGSATFTFNAEDERDGANEVKVEIVLPEGVTQQSVTPSAPVGWTPSFTATPSVVFSHAAPGPQGDQSFTLALSELPDADELVFKALVTYDNGDVERWIDEPTGGGEPPHPAAVVSLTGPAPVGSPTTVAPRSTPNTLKHPDKTNAGGIALVIIGAVVVVGLLLAFALRGRKSATP
jgi:uncharacterized protein YcnI